MSKCTATRSPRVAVAYLRASKNEQRLSREAQRAAIEAWAIREGVRVAAWCTDHGVRSVSPIAARPALRAALAALRRHGAGIFVVARRDRIARDVVLAASVEAAVSLEAARVVSVSGEGNGDSPADAFIRTVIDGAAQYEHGLIRSRTCAALAAKRARGERIGSVPLGFGLDADGVTLVVNEREQATIARARELRASRLTNDRHEDLGGQFSRRSISSRHAEKTPAGFARHERVFRDDVSAQIGSCDRSEATSLWAAGHSFV